MKKSYCAQNRGDCESCSLQNYGMDCQNNPVGRGGPGRNQGRKPINADPMARIQVTIRKDQAEWLSGKNRSEQVRGALDLLIKKAPDR